ncbi:MAG: TRAP transporter large permease [Lachnospiraceae bacterium]|nr:TRAP transporter large permease [Lachnospiraceae bacterium]
MSQAVMCGVIMLVLVFVLLIIGAPVCISIGVASAAAMVMISTPSKAILISAQKMFAGTSSFSLMAIPFFILAGVLMNNGGIAKKLVNCAKLLAGGLPGSLAQTNIVANMLFGAVSGSGCAAAAAIGGIMGPIEEEEGYDKSYYAAVNIASAPTGMMIPPSNTLIVYATVAGTVSISALFMAGYMPGILWGLGNMVVAGIMAKKLGYRNTEHLGLKESIRILLDAIPCLMMIVVVIGGILIGAFTATEGSGIAVAYSLILGLIYKNIRIKDIPAYLLEAANMTSIIIIMIGISSIMSYVMAFTGIPKIIAEGLMGITTNKYIILLIMNIFLLILGTFMDPTPAILIFTPIFLPICQSFGMHPVQFGLMITFNLCIGAITPPVGTVMFTGCRVANTTIEAIIKKLLPFFGVTALVLLLVTYVEPVTMLIPRLLGLV